MGSPLPRRSRYKSDFEHRLALSLLNRGFLDAVKYEKETYKYNSRVYKGTCVDCSGQNVVSVREYTPDWFLPNGIIVESKGKFTPPNRTQMLEVITSHPDKDIRMVFQYDNWLTRGKKTRYSDWCNQHGIKYAVGDIPTEWITEDKT